MGSPNRRAHVLLLVALCAFLVGTLAWASLAEVEIAAVAPGRVVPHGQVKTVRSFEQGKIRRIAVEEGSVVKSGDLLIELDTTLVDAEIAKHTSELGIKAVEAARLEALLGWRGGKPFRAPPDAPEQIVAINKRLLADQIAHHRAHLLEIAGMMAERRARIRTLQAGLGKHENLLPILRERTRMHETLYRKDHGSRLELFREQERLVELEGELALAREEIPQAEASLATLRAQRQQALSGFDRENRAALAAVRERMLVLDQDIRKAREHRARHTLVSPVDGVVQDLAVHTENGMVEPGARLMVIVPRNTSIRVEAFVSNVDIGFVKPGQRVTLKITTFDFRRYGAIEGTVSHIGEDAVNSGPQSGSLAATDAAMPAAAGPMFKALIKLDQDYMDVEGRTIPLVPGMTAEAAVILGRQRIIDYVLLPLRGYRQDAFREK